MSVIGQSVRRIDALGKVTGKTLYPGDINKPNQAHMKILFAQRPHAIIRRIDTQEAESTPGVLAVLTAKDVPVNEYGLQIQDQPVLCGPGSDKPFADRVRFPGDQIALVVAETERIAEEAKQKIVVEYEDLPQVEDPLAAMQPDAFCIHPDRDDNIMFHYKLRTGDVEAGFAEADVIVEAEYHTPAQEHAYLQPEAGIAYIDDEGRVTVETAGQWAHEEQEQIAHSLGLPEEKVRVMYAAIGGAFGGREDMSVQIVLALAAWKLHQQGIDRPVKIIWSREESIVGHCKRHPYIIRAAWGAKKDGTLVAATTEMIQDGGAYCYTSNKVMGNSMMQCTGPYHIPNVKTDGYCIYTTNVPSGAFRGFGGPQGAFSAEQQMNKLAEALGMDPVEIRMKNLLREGVPTVMGDPLPEGVSLEKVVTACAEASGWKKTGGVWESPAAQPDEPHLKRGIGFACGLKNVGFSFGAKDNCTATIELRGEAEIEKVVLYHAGADVGQGNHTVMAQMTAEAVGVPLEKVEVHASDTSTSMNSGSASASRLTFMSGNSIRGAAAKALEKWEGEERPAIATYQYFSPPTTAMDEETGHCDPNFSYGYVAQTVTVEVDVQTGHVRLVDVVCADDVGKALNPQQVQGQIEGCIIQAAGYALLENFQQQDGHVQTAHFSTYLIPTVLDIPERVDSLILEYADPEGPFGARGMGEMPYIPFAPAVMAAVRDATGVWFDAFPLTPDRVVAELKRAGVR